MDPLSLTLGLITAFKEVYLLSQCVYKACASAKASDEEREKLRQDFRYELVYVQSFGKLYLKNPSVTEDTRLDEYWLSLCKDIFERLESTLGQYRKLDDPFYNQWSPIVNPKKYLDTNSIEFPFEDSIPPAATGGKKLTLGLAEFFNRAQKSTAAAGKSAKWALHDKKKLETTVAAFSVETGKLRQVLVLAQSSQVSKLGERFGALTATIKNHDALILGLVPHAELLEFNEKEEESYVGTNEMKNCVVHASSSDAELSSGTIEFKTEGSKIVGSEPVLIELKHYPLSDDGNEILEPDPDTENNVRRLAQLLKISSAGSRDLRTLPFKYYVHQPKEERYAFIFSYPLHTEESQPISLYELIKTSAPEHRFTLATRFKVAHMIAQSIGVFHADGWVHKSVCSQSIVFFKDRRSKSLMLESPYLVDFGYSRPAEGKTFARYHQTTNRTQLYLHPDRPRVKGTKLHDLYALGIILLEIATWRVAEDHFNSALGGLDAESVDKQAVRQKFLHIARKSIPYHMGTAYMEAVVACLDDTYRSQATSPDFVEVFQAEVIEKLSAQQLL